jgi:hypothetical protein
MMAFFKSVVRSIPTIAGYEATKIYVFLWNMFMKAQR